MLIVSFYTIKHIRFLLLNHQ
uniref:Uncharacterized protein n=1 Tax=Arundo donax TaxID=35708 RepID=A0A0A9CER1_ARUDO